MAYSTKGSYIRPYYYPSDTIIAASTTATNHNSTSNTKVNELELGSDINADSQFRFVFDLKTGNAGVTAYASIFINGSPVGSTQSTASEAYVEKSQDITYSGGWKRGDKVQVYSRTGNVAQDVYTRNFYLKATESNWEKLL